MNQVASNHKLEPEDILAPLVGLEIYNRDDGLIGISGSDIVYHPKTFWNSLKGNSKVEWSHKK